MTARRLPIFKALTLAAATLALGVTLMPDRADAGAVTAADSIRLAQQALNDGKVDRAVRLANRALRRNGDKATLAYAANTVLCLAGLREQSGQDALAACTAAASAKPDSWRALNNRGIARYQTGDYAGAAADYEAALAAGGPAKMLKANLALAEEKRPRAQR